MMADFLATCAVIAASYLPIVAFLLGCIVLAVGAGYLVLETFDRCIGRLILTSQAYCDLVRFLKWRLRHPKLHPDTIYTAAMALYKREHLALVSPDTQAELWADMRDALGLPEGTAATQGSR